MGYLDEVVFYPGKTIECLQNAGHAVADLVKFSRGKTAI
jgi:hypothetical protein